MGALDDLREKGEDIKAVIGRLREGLTEKGFSFFKEKGADPQKVPPIAIPGKLTPEEFELLEKLQDELVGKILYITNEPEEKMTKAQQENIQSLRKQWSDNKIKLDEYRQRQVS